MLVLEPDVILAQTAVKGRVWVCGPATAVVYIDVCVLCCLKGTWKPSMIESGGHAEPILSFTGPGIADPAPCWMLQQEGPDPHGIAPLSQHLGYMLPLIMGRRKLTLMAWA